MKVTEKFMSIEGEGKRTGVVCLFIRLAGCNLRCGYCDTNYSQSNDDGKEESVEDIVKWAETKHVQCVTVTGGEPLIHKNIESLLVELVYKGFLVNVETNGSVYVDSIRDKVYTLWYTQHTATFPRSSLFFTVDYKCPSSLMESKMCKDNFNAYAYALTHDDCVKFVVGSEEDLNAALSVYSKIGKGIKCFISPVWGNITLKEIVDFMLVNRETFSTNARIQIQLHKIIYPVDMRGV